MVAHLGCQGIKQRVIQQFVVEKLGAFLTVQLGRDGTQQDALAIFGADIHSVQIVLI